MIKKYDNKYLNTCKILLLETSSIMSDEAQARCPLIFVATNGPYKPDHVGIFTLEAYCPHCDKITIQRTSHTWIISHSFFEPSRSFLSLLTCGLCENPTLAKYSDADIDPDYAFNFEGQIWFFKGWHHNLDTLIPVIDNMANILDV